MEVGWQPWGGGPNVFFAISEACTLACQSCSKTIMPARNLHCSQHKPTCVVQVQHYAGLPAESARIIDLDRLGMNMEATYQGDTIPVRLAYPR